MRIFLDANILFSSVKTDGAIRRLLAMLLERGHELWVDAYVVEEARRNLAAKAPNGLGAFESLRSRMHLAGTRPLETKIATSLPLVEKDRPVLAAAVNLQCQVLLTSDLSHFGHLYNLTLHGTTIHSPSSLAAEILREESRHS